MIKNFGQLYSAEIGLITNDADILLLTEIFPKLQWECGCRLGVRKCIGATQRKFKRYPPAQFLEVVSRLESPGLGVGMITEGKQIHFTTAMKALLCKVIFIQFKKVFPWILLFWMSRSIL